MAKKRSGSANRGNTSTASYAGLPDRRFYNPNKWAIPLTYAGIEPRITYDRNEGLRVGTQKHYVSVHKRPVVAKSYWTKRPVGLQLPVGVMFESPLRVVTCARRKMRRQVLFAKRRTGKGAKARRHKRNQWSDVRC